MSDGTLALPHADEMSPPLLCAASFLGGYLNEGTLSRYRTDLRIFLEWCRRSELDPFQARKFHLQAFVRYLALSRRNGPATIDARIGTIRGYYETAIDDGYCSSNPARRLKLPPVVNDPTKRPWLSRFEMAAVLREASKTPADWALITLIGTLGMRVSAACAVQIEDIHTTPEGYRMLRTTGKGGKTSLKVIPVPACAAIDAAAGGRTAGPLLLRRDGSQMTRKSAAFVVDRVCKRAGVTRHMTPHAFRRSHVTNLLKAGVPVEVVADSVDHADTRITMRTYNAATRDPHAQASNILASLLASAG